MVILEAVVRGAAESDCVTKRGCFTSMRADLFAFKSQVHTGLIAGFITERTSWIIQE